MDKIFSRNTITDANVFEHLLKNENISDEHKSELLGYLLKQKQLSDGKVLKYCNTIKNQKIKRDTIDVIMIMSKVKQAKQIQQMPQLQIQQQIQQVKSSD